MKQPHKFPSIYTGTIVQNNDPHGYGRVKVWVPAVGPALQDIQQMISSNNPQRKDIDFKFPGDAGGIPVVILNKLKDILPWGQVLNPIFGAGGSGVYNSKLNDSFVHNGPTPETPGYELTQGLGTGPTDLNSLAPAINAHNLNNGDSTGSDSSVGVDPFPFLRPDNISQKAHGVYSTLTVGQQVMVQFLNGESQHPIVTGTKSGGDDYHSNYSEQRQYNTPT